jgi:cytochrome c-type biogenesis protein CcmF
VYKVTSLWGGQQGSLLFWTWLLSIFTSIAAFQNRRRNPEIAPYALAFLAGVAIFFLLMLNFVTRPFDLLATVPAEGSDLNPLLQNYWMAIHPPSLYTGYVSATVPFAFGAAALITGKLDDGWIRSTRRWAIFSWFFLTLGNMFGARWAYEVLGWGGYWAWDPVENAAFMPWLVMTAYLHSVMIQERSLEPLADRARIRADALRHVHHAQRRHLVGAFVHAIRPRPVFFELPHHRDARV